jgi:hypothetical protein
LDLITAPRRINSDVMLLPDVTYQILGWALVVVAPVTPALVIAFSVRNYRLGLQDFETIRFKALVAILVWLVLTLGMFMLLSFLAYVMAHAISRDPSARPHPTFTYLVIHVMYFAVCYLLVDWASRRKRVPPSHSTSPGAA